MFHVHLTLGSLAALALTGLLAVGLVALVWALAGPAAGLLVLLVLALIVQGVKALITTTTEE
ncbi:hypothetical protein OOZ19_24975 [Saccharopolyspora sp. NFXS83]|uniref:CHASE2 domain-containing sensor protein n=1 Tax=Saccharopolyspora gloriosae TaxID=455344 RepID=A0A840NUD3_9PSEU|nr:MULTISPECIES: hypothetical protein [Saccharopolyspora]MBB5072832.1 CHASE2 domain-containing sensor protein [Saccharopolyspora gloriosae]MCX2733510.1 hypothetical protein [Saccharopolyspora sp. NFXS83]